MRIDIDFRFDLITVGYVHLQLFNASLVIPNISFRFFNSFGVSLHDLLAQCDLAVAYIRDALRSNTTFETGKLCYLVFFSNEFLNLIQMLEIII